MSRTWFTGELETVATFWRIQRRDGVTFGFTTHDRDLWFDGVLHLASPGMVPSAMRRTAAFEPDSVEVQGALSHETITADDLAAGRFDGAGVRVGLVDWETGESRVIHGGTIGMVSQEGNRFATELVSRKAELLRDPVPRTSPTCRAEFCGAGCNLNPERFTREVRLAALDLPTNAARFDQPLDPLLFAGGRVRWVDGPQAGAIMGVMAGDGSGGLVLDVPIDEAMPIGTAAVAREGCDHTLNTCATRFGNAVNFRGEPFLPGNDLLTRYPAPGQ